MDREFFKGKGVVVMGLGVFAGGVDSALFAYNAGARVTVTDLAGEDALGGSLELLSGCKGIQFHLGRHFEEDFVGDSTDIVIVNPAVPPDNKFVAMARDAGKVVTSQVELFFQLAPCRIVGITGANGKSTTTALTAHILEKAGGLGDFGFGKVYLAGNIGNRPLLGLLDEITENDVAVLELSSFQLEVLGIGPDIALVTNVTPNHLDRHGTFEEYCRAKENMFKFQKLDGPKPAVSIFNAEDEVSTGWFGKYDGQAGRKCVLFNADDVPGFVAEKFPLAGRVNLSNLAAARRVGQCFGISDEVIAEVIGSFATLPNRLELVGEVDGVRWYDDSIATTPVSAVAALEAFDCGEIIIAGGYDKGLPFDELGRCIAKKAKGAVLIGVTAAKIAEAIGQADGVQVCFADSMEQAVTIASGIAAAGDVVLMSPACASYDMFDNYRQRGEIFRKAVASLG